MTHKMRRGDLKNRFRNPEEYQALSRMLEDWGPDPRDVRGIFLDLLHGFMEKEGSIFTFTTRRGVSSSLKAYRVCGSGEVRLFGLVDIIGEDPAERWLSVCFYDKSITDPMEAGNLIPAGLLGEDGYCFDISENDGPLGAYLMQRIDEAHTYAKSP